MSSSISSAVLSRMLSDAGIRYVIGSPGSRNFPLLAAFERNRELRLEMVVDERSAAFSALGIAVVKGEPVALCCTSGSAMLNYTPAIAEAFYRNVPLLVITADRPIEGLGNGEPQMIDQALPMRGLTETVCDIAPDDSVALIERKCSDAIERMVRSRRPVQINVRFSEPMTVATGEEIEGLSIRPISRMIAENTLPTSEVRKLGKRLAAPAKVMIYVGQNVPDHKFSEAIRYISTRQNIVVAAEPISNLYNCPDVIYGIERWLKNLPEKDKRALCPDILISVGGSPTGRLFREYIREYFSGEVWRVGSENEQNDFYGKPLLKIVTDKTRFMRQLSSAVKVDRGSSDYAEMWHSFEPKYQPKLNEPLRRVLSAIPHDANIVFSNGLTVRYAASIRPAHHRYDSNRGVNGIDGTTSTAIGASWAYSGKTVLLTGDMSAAYDMSAWVSPLITPRFKAVVFDNAGGGIFRRVPPAGQQPECERLACCSDILFPLATVLKSCGFEVFGSNDAGSIEDAVGKMYSSDSPAVCIIRMSE